MEHGVAFDAMPPFERCNIVHEPKRAPVSGAPYWSVVRRIHETSMALVLHAFAARATRIWRAIISIKSTPNIGVGKFRCSDEDASRATVAWTIEFGCVSDDVKPGVDASSSKGSRTSLERTIAASSTTRSTTFFLLTRLRSNLCSFSSTSQSYQISFKLSR